MVALVELQGSRDEVKMIESALTKRHVVRRTFVGPNAENVEMAFSLWRSRRKDKTVQHAGLRDRDWLPSGSLKTCQVSQMRSYLV